MAFLTTRTITKIGLESSLTKAVCASSQIAKNAREVVEVFFDQDRCHMF